MHSKITGIINPVLAGFSIGIAAVCFLRGGQLIGAALFAFGLSTIVLASTFAMANPATVEAAHAIVDLRLSAGFGLCLLYSIGCGFIMTVAVKYARAGQWIPLLLGIPTFIICGFPHCIADIVYYAADGRYLEVIPCWIASIIGNSIGGNMPTYTRFLKGEQQD